MSAPISIDIEVTAPESVALDVETSTVDIEVGPGDPQVLLVAVPGPPGPPGSGTAVYGEEPSGDQDGVNATFTLAHVPRAGTTAVYRNGLREMPGTGYAVSGPVITFTTSPLPSDEIVVDYLEG